MRARTKRLMASLSLLVVGAGTTWSFSRSPEPFAPILSSNAAVSVVPKVNALGPASGYAEITTRPLFTSTRRRKEHSPPPAPTPMPQSPPAKPMPALEANLSGVILSPEDQYALLRWANGRREIVRRGDAVDDWTLIQLDADRALFASGPERVEIGFPVARSSAPASAPAPSSQVLVRRK